MKQNFREGNQWHDLRSGVGNGEHRYDDDLGLQESGWTSYGHLSDQGGVANALRAIWDQDATPGV